MVRPVRAPIGTERIPAHTINTGDQIYDEERLVGTVSHTEPHPHIVDAVRVVYLTSHRLVKCEVYPNRQMIEVRQRCDGR